LQNLAKFLDFFRFLAICFQEIGIYDIIVDFQKNHKWRKSLKKITGLNSNFVKKISQNMLILAHFHITPFFLAVV
jgi:hypothetical protein